MSTNIFSFENTAVRTLGNAELPLFVAVDVATALGYANPKAAPAKHVDPEDLIKAEITDSMNRTQTVNCVNESGLYALIFGSKLDSAKRFKRWVTSEVLPAIRRTGQYEAKAPEYLTPEQGWAIQSEVKKRVHADGVDFQTVYRALKAQFRVPKYTFLQSKDFEAAVEFIRTCELSKPRRLAAPEPEAPAIPPGSVVLSDEEARSLLSFIYTVRYLFADTYQAMYKMLRLADSPLGGAFYDAFYEVNWHRMLSILANHGHDIRDLKCYQHWLAKRRPA